MFGPPEQPTTMSGGPRSSEAGNRRGQAVRNNDPLVQAASPAGATGDISTAASAGDRADPAPDERYGIGQPV
jgi:hypothetical protein